MPEEMSTPAIQNIQELSDKEERLESMVHDAIHYENSDYAERWLSIAKLATSIATFYVNNPTIWSLRSDD